MSQNRGTFQYGITFDTSSAKKSLQELEALMSKMDKMSVSDFMKVSGETNFYKAAGELQDLQTELKKVKTAYKEAFDSKLGVVNMQEFLKKTGSNIQDLSQKFNRMGAAGSKAFASMHANSIKISSAFRETNTLLDKMGKSLMNTIKWNISSSLVNTFTGKVQEAYGYVKHLDSSLNDIRIVTGKSADEMSRFAKEANQAAQQLGKTTTDYTEASLIYYQQGLSDSDVKNMTDLTLKASNVTGEATAQVSEYFTALKNGYQIATEDMESQVDKMAAVAATTASDLGELSTAVSRVASTAAASGVGLDSLIAQISTIESVTRQAPESIGTALKTVYARLGDLKVDGSIIDEDGFEVKLGEVSGQLQQMGVNILDVNGNMRDQQEVIEEIGAKWQNWTKEQKEAAAIAMAGKRQYNNLFALFENFDQYNKAMETSAGSLGTLQKQQEIYEESTEYHLNKLTTQWEDFYDSMLDTHTINTVTDLFTGLLKGITTITDALGGGVNVLTTFIGLMGQLQSKNIVNTFVKPIIDQKFAKQFSDNNIAQVQANIQSWQAGGKISNSAVAAQQEYAKTMSPYMSNFTKEDAQSYNSAIDELGQSGEKIRELEIDIEKTTKDIKDLREGFLDTFQLSREETGLSEEEFKSFKESVLQVFDKIGEKAPQDLEKFGDAIDKLFKKKLNQAVDDAQIRLQELEQALKKMDIVDGKGPGQRNYSAGTKSKKRQEIMNSVNVERGSYSTNREALTAAIEEQKNKVQELKEASTEYNGVIEQTNEQVQRLVENTQHLSQSEEEKAAREKAQAADLEAKLLEAQQQAAQKRAQHYVEVAGAVTTLASSLNSLINIGNTVNGMLNGSIPPLQGVLTIITTLGMTIPMLAKSFITLTTTQVGSTIAVVAYTAAVKRMKIADKEAEITKFKTILAQEGLNVALEKGAVSAKAFWTSLLAPVAALAAIYWAYKRIKGALEEDKVSAEELEEKFNELKNKATEAESALKQTCDRLKEIDEYLANPGKYEISSQEDLDRLKAEKEELLAIKEAQEIEARTTAVDAANATYAKLKSEEGTKKFTGAKYEIDAEVGGLKKVEVEFSNLDEVKEEIAQNEKNFNNYRKLHPGATTADSPDLAIMAQTLAENRAILQLTENNQDYWAKEVLKYSNAKKQFDDAISKGGKVDATAYEDVSEHLKDATKHMKQLTSDSEQLKFNVKETKFDWNDDRNKAATSTKTQLESWSEGSELNKDSFRNTDFGQVLKTIDIKKDLGSILGENLTDNLFKLQEGTLTDLNAAKNTINEVITLLNLDKGLSDGVLSPEEIKNANITLDDYNTAILRYTENIKQDQTIVNDLTKTELERSEAQERIVQNQEKINTLQSAYNDISANTLNIIGASNEEFVAMQQSLINTNKALKDFKVGDKEIQHLAMDALKMQKNFDKASDSIKSLKDLVKRGIKLDEDPEALKIIEDIKTNLADAYEIPKEAIQSDYIAQHYDEILKGIKAGGDEARKVLRELITDAEGMISKEFIISLGFNDEEVIAEEQALLTNVANAVDAIDPLEAGAVLDTSQFNNALTDLLNNTNMTAVQIQSALNSIGIDVDVDVIEDVKKNLADLKVASEHGMDQGSYHQAVEMQIAKLQVRAKPMGSVSSSKKSPSGGGGGGSSKGSQPKQTDLSIDKISDDKKVEKMEAEVDRYHEIDTAIKMTENSLERYGKISDKVFGIDKVKNYKDQIAAIDKEVGQLGDKLAIARDHQDEMQKKLADKGYTFNNDGTIANYDETFKKEKSKVDAQYKDLKKRIKDYKKDIKNYNTEAYKAEEKSQKLKFTEKEEKRYDDLTAKVNKAKKEAKKKDTYDKLKDEEKKYLGLGDKEKKELKALNKKLGDQKKLKEKYDRWEYLRQKQRDAKLSKKEKDELEKLETKDKTLAGFAAKLDKTGVQLDKDIEKYEKSQTKFTELIQLADEYDEHVSEFIENLIQQIDEQIQEKAEAKIELLNMKIQLELDTDNLTKQWNEFKNTINLNTYNSSALAKSRVGASEITTFSKLTAPTEALGRSGTYNSEYDKTQRNLKLRENYLTAQDTLISKAANTQEYKNLQTAKTAFNTAQSNFQALETRRTNIKADMINLDSQIHNVKAQYDAALAEKKKTKGKSKKDKELDQQRVDDLAHQLKVLTDRQIDAQNALVQTENQLTDATQELAKSQNNLNTAQTQYDAVIQTASDVVTAYQDGMDASVYGVNQEALKENLQKDIETLQSYGQSIAEAFNNQLQLLTDVVNETVDDFHKINDSINSYIDANKKVQDLYIKYYGTEGSLDKRIELSKSNQGRADENIKIYKALGNTLAEELNTIQTKAKTDSENFQAELNKVQSLGINKYTDYNTLVKTLGDAEADNFIKLANTAEASEKALNNVKDKIDENNSNLIDAIQQSTEEIIATRDLTIEKATLKLHNSIWNGQDATLVQKKYDWQKENNSKYYDEINSAYQIQKLNYNIQQKIDKLNNPAKQQQLNKILQDRIKLLKEQGKLTQYQVERVQKEFDIEMARIALEEAQNNKSTLRLRRDSQGNYSYQYTNDADDVAQKKQDLLDKIIDLYNHDKKQLEALQEEALSNQDKMEKELQEAMADYYSKHGNFDNFDKIQDLIVEKWTVKNEDLARQMEEVRNNLTSTITAGAKGSGGLAVQYLDDLELFDPEGMRIKSDEIYEIVNRNKENIEKDLTEYADTTKKAYTDATTAIETSAKGAFNATDEVGNAIEALAGDKGPLAGLNTRVSELESTVNSLSAKGTETTKAINGNIDAVGKKLDEFYTLYKPKLAEMIDLLDKLQNDAIQEIKKEIPGSGEGENLGETNQVWTSAATKASKLKVGAVVKVTSSANEQIANPTKADSNNFDVKKDANKNPINAGFDGTQELVVQDVKTSKEGTYIKVNNKWIKALYSNGDAYGHVLMDAAAFSGGGYTGEWESNEGKIGILHQRELVLDQKDTENILAAVRYMRDSMLLNAMQIRMSGMSSGGAAAPTQNIQITANFPNASNHLEIETAFNNLLNRANQYMGRKF